MPNSQLGSRADGHRDRFVAGRLAAGWGRGKPMTGNQAFPRIDTGWGTHPGRALRNPLVGTDKDWWFVQ